MPDTIQSPGATLLNIPNRYSILVGQRGTRTSEAMECEIISREAHCLVQCRKGFSDPGIRHYLVLVRHPDLKQWFNATWVILVEKSQQIPIRADIRVQF